MFLTKKAFLLKKKDFTKDELEKIKKDLIVKPLDKSNYGPPPEEFSVYDENDEFLYTPKYYGKEKFKNKKYTDKTKTKTKSKKNTDNTDNIIDIQFQGELRVGKMRKTQTEIVNIVLKGIKEKGGGLLSVPPGSGKTVLALYIACQLKLKTLVIVHKSFLVKQWIERIEKFTNARIGTIRQKKIKTDNKDIVVGMLQSIAMIEYDLDVFDQFDLVIVDECHRSSSRIFSQALPKISTKYTLGLSATPIRPDGLTKVFKWYLGDFLYREAPKPNNQVIINNYKFYSDSKFFQEKLMYNKFQHKRTVNIAKMVNNVVLHPERNKFIVSILKSLAGEGRKILVISERLSHLKELKEEIDESANNTWGTGYYVGGMKDKDLKETEDKDIIFATIQMASEGLDIEALDTLVLTTSIGGKNRIEQTMGRILRKDKFYDIRPVIVDIADQFSIFEAHAERRMTFYKQNKYQIKIAEVNDGKFEDGELFKNNLNEADEANAEAEADADADADADTDDGFNNRLNNMDEIDEDECYLDDSDDDDDANHESAKTHNIKSSRP